MLVNTPEKLEELVKRIEGSDTYVLDTETSGFYWQKDFICGWVWTFGPKPSDTYYVPVRHKEGKNIDNVQEIEKVFIKNLNLPNKTIIFHNASFDLSFLHVAGWRYTGQKIRDTMIECFLTYEIRPSLSLDACCRDYGVQAKKGTALYEYLASKSGGDADRKQMGNFWKSDPEEKVVWDYAAGDGTSTYQLSKAVLEDIKKEDAQGHTLELVHKVESDLIPVLHKKRMRGIKINEEILGKITKITEDEYEVAQSKLGDLNVRSGIQMREYFIQHGIKDWPVTEKGNPSFPEHWLLQSEPGKIIVTTRKHRNLLNSFLHPIRDTYLTNGRIHPEYHQTRGEEFGTRTGRLSTTSPNIGAMPGKRQGERGKMFRQAFEPDEGKTWTEIDYEVCEIRIATHYCGAKLWLKAFEAGENVHETVAKEIGSAKAPAKAINLGLMTGMGKAHLISDLMALGMNKEDSERTWDAYFRRLPELRPFQIQSKKVFESRGYVRTVLGRRLHLEDSRFSYKAVNRLTQGGNADLLKTKLVEVDRYLEDRGEGELITSVYDAVSWQTDDVSRDNEICDILCDVKNGDFKLNVPLKIEYGNGTNWSEATFFDE